MDTRKGLFDFPHIICRLHDRRRQELRPYRLMIAAQPLFVVGQRHSFFDIFFRRERTEFGKPCIHEQTVAKACIMALSNQRDDRYAHIQGITGRTAPRIRIRIQRDIHLVIGLQILGLLLAQNQPLGGNSRLLNAL